MLWLACPVPRRSDDQNAPFGMVYSPPFTAGFRCLRGWGLPPISKYRAFHLNRLPYPRGPPPPHPGGPRAPPPMYPPGEGAVGRGWTTYSSPSSWATAIHGDGAQPK